MEQPQSEKSIIALYEWLDSPAGRYVAQWEQARFDALTSDIFGYRAVQLGLPTLEALAANRMPSKWVCDYHPLGAPDADGLRRVQILCEFGELPFASNSLDLVVLPHVLEFASEPHRVLREVERVLIPEGQVIVSGFNPASLWGLRQGFGRMTGAHFLPVDGEFIGIIRLKDWLKLLNMEVNRGHFGCYALPFSTEKWLSRCGMLEKAGDRWWPYLGAVYMVQAVKRVHGMRLVGPALSKKRVKKTQGIPVVNKTPDTPQ